MDMQPPPKLAANITSSRRQAGYGILDRIWTIVEHGKKYFCMRVVGRDLNFCNRDHADARIFQFKSDNFREIPLNLIGNAQTARGKGFTIFGHDGQSLLERRTLNSGSRVLTNK